MMHERWLLEPGTKVHLAAIDPGSTVGAPGDGDKASAKEPTRELRHRLRELQGRLWAERGQALLVVLQAMDAGGKDGTIKHVFKGVNPQGTKVTSFKQPTEDELEHDFLWRVHKVTPAKGEIGIFNRSHYEDVLVVRVHDLVPEHVWRARFDTINHFEDGLAQAGTRIVKVFLHISKEEQARRLRRRLERPDKRWKLRTADLEERKYWDDYQHAYEDALAATTSPTAPWYVVPADQKWFRNWAALQILVATLEDMDPQFPEPAEDLSRVHIS
jgi:PPK2 family polyphosphate:nucleotide phosphotransferase